MDYSIAIIIICIAILITLAVVEIAVYAAEGEDYNFVKCPNDNIVYPEGTDCDGISEEEDFDDGNLDDFSEEAMEESDDD